MERTNGDKSLTKVSPFLIQRVIDNTITGKVELCKKLRNGQVLIKTKNITQANKLIKLHALNPEISIEINEHPTMNKSKGVIYCKDLIYMSDDEIINELQSQQILKVDRITRLKNDNIVQTGLFILTFTTIKIPEHIYIGYEKINVRHYIPQPLRCKNCLHFEHKTEDCKKPKICVNCNKAYHFTKENPTNEKCNDATQCTNCHSREHNSLNKKCPVYTKLREIMKIKVTERTDIKTAKQLYKQRYPTEPKLTYASALLSTKKILTDSSTQTKNDKQTPTNEGNIHKKGSETCNNTNNNSKTNMIFEPDLINGENNKKVNQQNTESETYSDIEIEAQPKRRRKKPRQRTISKSSKAKIPKIKKNK